VALNIKGSAGRFNCKDCGCSVSRRSANHVGSAKCAKEAKSESKVMDWTKRIVDRKGVRAEQIPTLTLQHLVESYSVVVKNGIASIEG